VSPLAPLKKDMVTFSARKDFLSLPADVIRMRIESAINDENNMLGKGGEAVVYKLPGTKYCVRLKKYSKTAYKSVLKFKVSEQDEVNHVVAKLGHGSSIMKYIEGTPVFSLNMSPAEAEHIGKTIGFMPISSFKELLHQICAAERKGMAFDCSWGNVIVNNKKNSLTAIDFYPSYERKNKVSSIYAALVCPDLPLKKRKMIAGKVLCAAIDELKPGNLPCIAPAEFDFRKFLFNVGSPAAMVKIIENSKFKELLENVLIELADLKSEELAGKNVKQLLTGKVKVAETLIRQLFFMHNSHIRL